MGETLEGFDEESGGEDSMKEGRQSSFVKWWQYVIWMKEEINHEFWITQKVLL